MIRTLIVEDDPMVMELNRQHLKQISGYKLVDLVSNVKDAISVMKKSPIDLVLLDTFMQEENGFQLLLHIRRECLNTDVIFITAARDKDSVQKALQYGVADYLIKPFTYRQFQEALVAYREKRAFIEKKDLLSHDDLDVILKGRKKKEVRTLQRGLTKATLRLIWSEIGKLNGKMFSTEDIAIITGISRVSMRKYLQFLVDIDVLTMKVEHGYVGRPVSKYEVNERSKELIGYYL